MVTGIRGLCNGIGPALFGFIFYKFDINLIDDDSSTNIKLGSKSQTEDTADHYPVSAVEPLAYYAC